MVRKIILLLAFFLIVGIAAIFADNNSGFVLYFWDNEEIIISDKDIANYDQDTNIITLTPEGIAKWYKFFPPYKKVIKQRLYNKKFFITLEGEKMYSGRFRSERFFKESDEVIIYIELSDGNCIKIDNPEKSKDYSEKKFKIFEFFQKQGKLV